MAGFNGSGTFVRTYNWVTDKGNSVKVTASRMDGEDDGFATGLSSVICKDGQTTQTAVIPFAVGLSIADGASNTPSFKFINDTDTGIFRSGANTLGVVAGGAQVFEFGTATASTSGSLVVGGTFVAASANFTATCAAVAYTGASANLTATCAAAVVAAPSHTGASANFTATCAAAVVAAPSHTGASANFTATCEAVTIKATTLIQNTGGQIAFPATQIPSADANTLDDYAEGTWTPALTFGGGATGLTYTSRSGTYTKIGRLVFFECLIQINSNGSSTGDTLLTGLPFTIGGTARPLFLMAADGTGVDTSDENSFYIYGEGNIGTTNASLNFNQANVDEQLGEWFFNDGSVTRLSGHYIV